MPKVKPKKSSKKSRISKSNKKRPQNKKSKSKPKSKSKNRPKPITYYAPNIKGQKNQKSIFPQLRTRLQQEIRKSQIKKKYPSQKWQLMEQQFQQQQQQRCQQPNTKDQKFDQICSLVNRLIVQNKVSMKNAFQVPIVDIQKMIDLETTRQNDYLWKRISSALQNGYKIYSYRVDATQQTAIGVLSTLLRHIQQDTNQKILNQDIQDQDLIKKLNFNNTLNNQSFNIHIQKNVKNINMEQFQIMRDFNPILQQNKRKFDQGGLKSLLLNTIPLDQDKRLQTNTDIKKFTKNQNQASKNNNRVQLIQRQVNYQPINQQMKLSQQSQKVKRQIKWPLTKQCYQQLWENLKKTDIKNIQLNQLRQQQQEKLNEQNNLFNMIQIQQNNRLQPQILQQQQFQQQQQPQKKQINNQPPIQFIPQDINKYVTTFSALPIHQRMCTNQGDKIIDKIINQQPDIQQISPPKNILKNINQAINVKTKLKKDNNKKRQSQIIAIRQQPKLFSSNFNNPTLSKKYREKIVKPQIKKIQEKIIQFQENNNNILTRQQILKIDVISITKSKSKSPQDIIIYSKSQDRYLDNNLPILVPVIINLPTTLNYWEEDRKNIMKGYEKKNQNNYIPFRDQYIEIQQQQQEKIVSQQQVIENQDNQIKKDQYGMRQGKQRMLAYVNGSGTTFSNVYTEYREKQGYISPALCFLTMLHIANQKSYELVQQQDDDFMIL